jgi:hypothetical protein
MNITIDGEFFIYYNWYETTEDERCTYKQKVKKKERRNTFEKSKTSRHTKGGFRNPRYSVSLVNKICLPEKYPAVASI